MNNRVPLIERQPPRQPLDGETTITTPKDFPMKRGDLLIVRNAKGLVTKRYTCGEYLYSDLKDRRVNAADVTLFDR